MSLSINAGETDEELMRRVQADDASAFDELYDRHAGRALAVAVSVCQDPARAEGAVQEGFLSIWRARASYRPGTGTFQAWAMKIVRRRAVDSIRTPRPGTRPQDGAISSSDGHALRVSLRGLPDAQAEVITLALFGELTHVEIASQVSLPERTVKGRMRLGLEELRTQLT